MRHLLKKLWKHKWALPYLLRSIAFNLKYLPWRQAKRLPILFRKPSFNLHKTARFVIDSESVYFGMIQLGCNEVSIFEDKGIYLDVGGTVVFKGPCVIGNQSRLSVAKGGVVEFGRYFHNTALLKIVCYSKIIFGDNVLVGWNTLFTDNDFHRIRSGENGEPKPVVKCIIIGHHSWLACNCMVMKGSCIPPYSIVSANSLVNKDYSNIPEHTLFAGSPAVPKRDNVYWN